MDKIHTLSDLEEELALKSSSEGILRDLIETQELLSSFEKLSSAKHSNGLSISEDCKRNGLDYNSSIQRKIYKWNFEKSTNKELIDSILLSIFSGGEEGRKIAQDYSKVLIEISYTQSKEETLLFLTRMEFSLSTTIKSLKDKIFNNKDIKSIYKASTEFIEAKERFSMSKLITSCNPKRSFCTCNSSGHFNKNGTIINFEVNDEFLKTVTTLLAELTDLLEVIMASAKEISMLFQSSFNLLYAEDDALKRFNSTEIIKEAFAHVVQKDNFIQKMFSIVRSPDSNQNAQDVVEKIELFEAKLKENVKEMTRLSCFIQEESLKLKGRRKQNDQIDLDDLVKYINNDNQSNANEKKDAKKPKKNMTKKMKKHKQNGLSEASNEVNTGLSMTRIINQEDYNELKEFQECLRMTSQIKFTFHKIQPRLSKEWISRLNDGINR